LPKIWQKLEEKNWILHFAQELVTT
jgi:hypothetical protein